MPHRDRHFEDILNATCTIQRKTVNSTDGAGQEVFDWTTDQTADVPCRIESRVTIEPDEESVNKTVVVESFFAMFKPDVSISSGNRLSTVVINGAAQTGAIYSVVIGRDGWKEQVSHHIEAVCARIKERD